MEIPKRLYHYTKSANALEQILPTKRIRFGSLGETNDPRESKEWLGSMGYALGDPDPPVDDVLFKAVAAFNEIQRKEWWVLCLSRDDPTGSDESTDGVSAFRRGYAHARMWAQYCEDHRGICLEFDGPILYRSIMESVSPPATLLLGDVAYDDGHNIGSVGPGSSPFHFYYPELMATGGLTAGVREHALKYGRQLFLEKAADWSSELEFRFLIHSPTPPPNIDITRALRSVIVGADFPPVYGPTVWNLCAALGVSVERMEWLNRIPRKGPWAAQGSCPKPKTETEE